MLDVYFRKPHTLARMRSGPTGPFMDEFAATLLVARYSYWTAVGHLRGACHLGAWMQTRKIALSSVTEATVEAFADHRATCTCLRRNRGQYVEALAGVRHFIGHLQEAGVLPAAESSLGELVPDTVSAFETWMTAHRGVRPATLANYRRCVVELIDTFRTPASFDTKGLRRFVTVYAARHGRGCAKIVITATRMFVRYAIAHGQCAAHLDTAIPKLAKWKLTTLPSYVPNDDVERLLAACDLSTPTGMRDHAILMLLAHLGLRGGDVVGLRLDDIDWKGATLRLTGKERRQVRLPLPQAVGDALLRYIDAGRPQVGSAQVFISAYAPWKPLGCTSVVSSVVSRTARRAGVSMPRGGAHVLRHTLATRLVREGTALAAVRVLLRHESEQTTAQYAKLDTPTLSLLAQPWPAPTSERITAPHAEPQVWSRIVQRWPLEAVSC